KGAAGFTSDQPEALRLIGMLTGPHLLKLCKDHDAALQTGLSGQAYLQVQAMHDQQKAVSAAPPGQQANQGGTAPALPADAALKFLQGADRSLGKSVSRAMKGESTTFYDQLTVKATVNREQLVG